MDSRNDVRVPASRSCVVCLHSMPLRNDGALRVHGPVTSRCPGFGKHPRSAPPPSMTPQPPQVHEHRTISSNHLPSVTLLPRVRLLRRLLQTSCDHAASKFTTVLEDVNRSNNENAWMRLLNFPRQCFKVPERGGRQWNLARLVKQQLAEECDLTSLDNPVPNACPPWSPCRQVLRPI